jgi:hypothetical protein
MTLFRYYRSDIKVVIQFITNPMQYGQILVSYLPYTSGVVDWVSESQQSQANGIVLDITEQNSVEITLPYLRPPLYFRTGEEEDTKSWRVLVQVLNLDTLTMDAPATFTMNVFANYENIEAAGYLPSAVFQSNRKASNPLAHAGILAAEIFDVGSRWSRGAGPAVEDQVDKATGNVRLDVLGDICAPVVHETKTRVKLGDGKPLRAAYTPGVDNQTMLSELVQRPTLVSTHIFSATGDIFEINCDPVQEKTYAHYLMRMFKFYRGGVKVLLKFSMSAMVSARVRISLFPSGGIAFAGDDAFGDVTSWVISLRGSQEWSTHVPYLQDRCWTQPGSEDYIAPLLAVDLIDSLPQPFDKPSTIFMSVFVSADSYFKMAGLQSCVASFQSLRDKFLAVKELTAIESFSYQGGVSDGYEILGRFSSRGNDPANHFPFPLKITDWDDLDEKDNYDYFCNLYKFYSGANHIKILFSEAPASGLLATTIGNTRQSATGDTFKGGNGVVVTTQAVWPTLDFTFPYMCEDEFNSLWETVPMYPQILDSEAVVSAYYISMSKEFRVYYLLPLPDFYFEPEEEVEMASFQSVTQLTENMIFMEEYVLVGGAIDDVTQEVLDEIGDQVISCAVDIIISRVSGSDDTYLSFFLGEAAVASTPWGTTVPLFGHMWLYWTDFTNSGTNTFNFKGTFVVTNSVGADTGLHFTLRTHNAHTSSFNVSVSISMGVTTALTTLTRMDAYAAAPVVPAGIVTAEDDLHVIVDNEVVVSAESPIPVEITGSVLIDDAVPVKVTIENPSAIEVEISGTVSIDDSTPVSVSIANTVDVNVTNPILEVSFDDSLPLPVVGVVGGYPVKVSYY